MAVSSLRLVHKEVPHSFFVSSLTFSLHRRSLFFQLREIVVPPGVAIFLPGSDIPDWFGNHDSVSSITIQLPQHWCNR